MRGKRRDLECRDASDKVNAGGRRCSLVVDNLLSVGVWLLETTKTHDPFKKTQSAGNPLNYTNTHCCTALIHSVNTCKLQPTAPNFRLENTPDTYKRLIVCVCRSLHRLTHSV